MTKYMESSALLNEEFLSQERSEVFADLAHLQDLMFPIFSQVMAFYASSKGEELYNLWEFSVHVSYLKQKNKTCAKGEVHSSRWGTEGY